jgi:circadian clock protein KaiB
MPKGAKNDLSKDKPRSRKGTSPSRKTSPRSPKVAPRSRKMTPREETARSFERAMARQKPDKYILRLYITGLTPRSSRAVENLKAVCEEYLQGHYELEIVDIYQHPNLMEGEQIFAAPTLIKKLPEPLRRLVGDMSDKDRVLLGLDLKPKKKEPLPKD